MKFIRDTITVAIAIGLTAFIGLSLARLTYFVLHGLGLL
jgi:predicted PurR-regulated permease PerM